jgi:DNA-3-methyladenine glycosylase I
MSDRGIVRNRLKIEATINNARRFIELQGEFGSFDAYIWQFVGGEPLVNARRKPADVPATTPESDALSADLKNRGFKFMGSTVVYAHMQATGMVNDHTLDCFRRDEIIRAQRSLSIRTRLQSPPL